MNRGGPPLLLENEPAQIVARRKGMGLPGEENLETSTNLAGAAMRARPVAAPCRDRA